MATCSCGCGTVTMVTETQESCSCGCDCCDVGALDPEEKIARLRELREAADRRLVELGAG